MDDRARVIAARALQRPSAERQAFLDGACADEPALRNQAAELLRALESTVATTEGIRHTAIPGPTAARSSAPASEAPTIASSHGAASNQHAEPDSLVEGPGATLGLYKILQLIGEGGFGNVYMAQQTHPVKRRVALKIVKPGMDTKQVIGRFESERQALAMMDHPNIARVYDAGTTPTGRPYFVMELVKGVPITEYCDSAQLSTPERLELFMSVCHAVQHAHMKGIVHRDLKPSNVLVTLHDEQPVVKVIDFGIAKAMNQDLTDQTVFTEFRQFIGTPEYMSPEQAAMSGLDVDSRTDIYSLGVLLYELMTGSTPFSSEELRSAGMAEIQRKIKEDEPPRPSTRIGQTTRSGAGSKLGGGTKSGTASGGGAASGGPKSTTAEQIAKVRRTDPGTLRRQLAGDLDWIVMKAMEKDRSRRYDTASALGDDIKRFLHNEPIHARPPSTAYRLRKFARRNRAAIGAGAGVLGALLLTLVALAYGLTEARRERDMTAERETTARAQIMLTSMNAVRKYTGDDIRPALAVAYTGDKTAKVPDYNTHFVKEMVPGYAARKVYLNFQKDPAYASFVYKEASDNPTNPDNKADDFEAGLLKQFKSDPSKKEVTGIREMVMNGVGSRRFYIARPMPIGDAKCLDCHTTPEMAPPEQVKMYGRTGGYNWKLNDIVAAQVVYVPVTEAFRVESRAWSNGLLVAAGVLVLCGGVGLVLLRRA